MEENENKQEKSVNTEELKNETVDNVKEEAQVAKGFVLEMFKRPLEKIKEMANDTTSKYLKTSILLLVIWAIAILVAKFDFDIFDGFTLKYFGRMILNYVKAILAPVLMVVTMSVILFIMKQMKK